MASDNIAKYADMLFEAEQKRTAFPPLTDQDSTLTVEDAYQIQLYNIKRAEGMGHVICGKKIGLTSEGIQKQMGVHEPDYGHLFEAMDCKDGKLKCDELIQPRIEAEMAFILKGDLAGGKVTKEDVIANTEYVVAAFEVVDSRLADWKIKLVDTVADNASSGRYVLGTTRLKPDSADLGAVTMKLFKNGEQIGEGSGAAVQGNPAEAVAWLANKMWSFGVTLKAGEVILSGAFSAAPPAARGDIFIAEFSSFGEVKAEFV